LRHPIAGLAHVTNSDPPTVRIISDNLVYALEKSAE
jgi:hypothetical protein